MSQRNTLDRVILNLPTQRHVSIIILQMIPFLDAYRDVNPIHHVIISHKARIEDLTM